MGRFRTEKIIKIEDEAVETSSLYILPIDDNTFRLIITDDLGNKKVNAVLTGSANFTQLGDAPISYTNSAGKVVTVNNTEDGLEFQELEALSATIEVGEVTAVDSGEPPQVINVGTDKNAIFNFAIPKGDTGEISVINFQVDDELHLIMDLQTNTNLNFTLDNNGHLILTN